MTRRLIMSVALIASCFLSLFVSNNTSALTDWYYISSTTGGMRGFTCFPQDYPYNNNVMQSYNGTWLESWNVPSVIFGIVPSGYNWCALSGVVFSSNINGGNQSNKYNTVEVIARFQQTPNSAENSTLDWAPYVATMGYSLSDGTSGNNKCSLYAQDGLALEWYCSVSTTNYQKVNAISIDWGAWKYPPGDLDGDWIATIDSNPSAGNNNGISLNTWRYRYESSSDPIPSMLDGIENTLNNVNNTILNINNTFNNQYNQEKQEENVREQQGQQDANDLSGLFNFSVINPLNALYSAVSANTQCVNIPTIAAMLHVQDTQYCNWFPQSVRNILTPVISLTSMMLVFGYLVSWLRQSSSPTVDIIERK